MSSAHPDDAPKATAPQPAIGRAASASQDEPCAPTAASPHAKSPSEHQEPIQRRPLLPPALATTPVPKTTSSTPRASSASVHSSEWSSEEETRLQAVTRNLFDLPGSTLTLLKRFPGRKIGELRARWDALHGTSFIYDYV